MTTTYRKKLIEVAMPLEAINAASVREKSIRHGHPSTLHLWWARRPLAACRAVLFAQLVDDPSAHPDQFPTNDEQDAERKRLFKIIEELVVWENTTNEEVLERARVEIRKSCGGELPNVSDPFSGGGSIPLEAQRLGLPAHGSDLNPVAVMIGKAMIEIPPKFKDMAPIHPGGKGRHFYRNAEGLAEDVKFYGEWMREKAWESIGHLYPQVNIPKDQGGGKATVIAWIWSRTVPCPDPAFSDVQVPIASSFLLSSKPGKEAWIEPIVDRISKVIRYRIRNGGTRAELESAKEGTKGSRANFTCLVSGAAITSEYIKQCGQAGTLGQDLIAIVAEGKGGRRYIAPDEDSKRSAVSSEVAKLASVQREIFLSGETPARLTGGTCHSYGLNQWGKLFTDRQIVGITTFSDLIEKVREKIEQDALAAGLLSDGIKLKEDGRGAKSYAEAISVYLAFGISKATDYHSSLTTWHSGREIIRNTFGRQSLPMTWDFTEANLFSSSTGNWLNCIEWGVKTLENLNPNAFGSVTQNDAQNIVYPLKTVISSDPPYYDNIAYADLSDFFFCWLRKSIKSVYPDVFGVLATPKLEELVATSYRHGGKDAAEKFFLDGMRRAIVNMAKQSSDDFPATIYYAFKQSEVAQEGVSSTGWATFLQAIVEAGYAVVGTWPMRTEMANRMVASGTNALANSVVLVCRKRDVSAEFVTRAEFIRTLKRELPPAIAELQAANIAPADMPQSAIGPGMGVFSRYKAVLESDDSPMSVKTSLQLVNRELDEYLGGIQGEFDADTRFAITWFEQNGLNSGDYGTANNLATARGISVESVKHAGIVESSAGKVRILNRDELAPDWHPGEDKHLTVWECLQYLVQSHENQGLSDTTAIRLQQLGDKAEAVKDLAYCLYDIAANKRKDAKEATAYNALIADWTELSRMAATVHDTSGRTQLRFEV
jgi:putative DNA methylase